MYPESTARPRMYHVCIRSSKLYKAGYFIHVLKRNNLITFQNLLKHCYCLLCVRALIHTHQVHVQVKCLECYLMRKLH